MAQNRRTLSRRRRFHERSEEGGTHVYHRVTTGSNIPVLQYIVLQHLLDVLISQRRSHP
jgi:hypothetical protein